MIINIHIGSYLSIAFGPESKILNIVLSTFKCIFLGNEDFLAKWVNEENIILYNFKLAKYFSPSIL